MLEFLQETQIATREWHLGRNEELAEEEEEVYEEGDEEQSQWGGLGGAESVGRAQLSFPLYDQGQTLITDQETPDHPQSCNTISV